MKSTLIAIALTAAVAFVLAFATCPAQADNAKSITTAGSLVAALAEAGKPGAEHRKLQPFVGDWTFTMKFWADPSQSPAEMTGTIHRKWIMGDRFVQETVSGQCQGKSFEGLGLLGYDNAQKKFTSTRACGLCGTVMSGLSTCDASGTKFECGTEGTCPLTGEQVKGRDEVCIESDDKIVTRMFKNIDGKEVKTMELISIRKK